MKPAGIEKSELCNGIILSQSMREEQVSCGSSQGPQVRANAFLYAMALMDIKEIKLILAFTLNGSDY